MNALLVSAPELCRLSGASYRHVDRWPRKGYLKPVLSARGPGTRRSYAADQIKAARRIAAFSAIVENESIGGVFARLAAENGPVSFEANGCQVTISVEDVAS